MKAMVLQRFGEPLQLLDVPAPELGPDEVLIKVAACGICGTDLKIASGQLDGIAPPRIMGHEVAGIVAAVGANVSNVAIGQHVAVALYVTCGSCDFCRTGRETLCVHLTGRPGFELNGGLAEYVSVPAYNVFPISAAVPFEQVAVLGDCVATAWHAVRRRARVQTGETVVIMGAGGLGLHALQITKLAGARAIAVDVVPEKLALAREWGAGVCVDARNGDVVGQVLENTDGLGADVVLDFSGSPAAVQSGLQCLKHGGVLTLVGYTPGQPFPVESADVVLSEKGIIGSRAAGKQDLVDVIRLVETGKIVPMVTQRYSLADTNQALADLRAGHITGRAVILLD